jgi:hypothetical protein
MQASFAYSARRTPRSPSAPIAAKVPFLARRQHLAQELGRIAFRQPAADRILEHP